MSKWGSTDFKQLQALQKKLDKLKSERQAFCETAAKELAARLLRKVIKRTLVGQYPKGSGMTGGTLRRGWSGQTMNIEQQGDNYTIDIINPVEYASYVEYGHRTRGHNGWVEGHFMLTISEQEIQNTAPQILEKKLAKWLGEKLNGK